MHANASRAFIDETYMSNRIQNLNIWLFNLDNWKKRLIKISFDAIIVPASLLMAFTVRLESFDFIHLNGFYISCVIAAISAVSIFAWRGLYSTFNKHASVEVAITILLGSLGSALFLFVGKYLANISIPLSVPLIYVTILCLTATSMRFIMQALEQSINRSKSQNVVIYGAGAAGTQLMEALRSHPNYRVYQFIDDSKALQGRTIAGIPIASFVKAKNGIIRHNIKTLLLAMAKTNDKTRERVSDLLSEQHINVKTIPSIESLISGTSKITELQDINIEDLLERDPVQPDATLMSKRITGKIVLVTGAGGSIGSELCRQVVQWRPKELILLDVSEYSIYTLLNDLEARSKSLGIHITPLIGSVQDTQFIKFVMERFSINTIFHAAAYKHVPLMELNVMQCISNNVFGTYNVAEQAIAAKVSDFILVSTDKAVNPTNFMGASKRFAEIICQSLTQKQVDTCFSIVRFGNVLGSSGSVVPLFKRQIENRETVTVTHMDITRFFMTIREAAQLVIQAASIAKGGEVFVLDMGKPVKILDLAKKMITLSGLNPVLNTQETANAGEAPIIITGLRPGEKLYEELSYSDNLTGTEHPRIMTTAEVAMSFEDLQPLVSNARAAIDSGDHEKLFEIIASIADGVSDATNSNDAFVTMKRPNSRKTRSKPTKENIIQP